MKTILCYGDSLTWGYDPEGPGWYLRGDMVLEAIQAALSATTPTPNPSPQGGGGSLRHPQ